MPTCAPPGRGGGDLPRRLPPRPWPGIRSAPPRPPRADPRLRLVELPESDLCCGSAGVYNLPRTPDGRSAARAQGRHIAATWRHAARGRATRLPAQIAKGCRARASSSRSSTRWRCSRARGRTEDSRPGAREAFGPTAGQGPARHDAAAQLDLLTASVRGRASCRTYFTLTRNPRSDYVSRAAAASAWTAARDWAGAGEAIVARAGAEHGLVNDGPDPLLVLVVVSPPPPLTR